MPADSYRSRYRGGRSRAAKEQPQSDAVVVSLTIQVLVVILLLLAAVLFKKADGAAYGRVRQQVDIMVTDTSQNREALELLSGSEQLFNGFFMAVEELVNNVLGRFGLAESPSAAAESSSETVEDTGIRYDYLNPAEVLQTAGQGQGGAFPVELGGGTGGMLQAPEGSVLSPVVLGANLLPPVTGLITSPFAYRYHPVWETTDFHTGMDIAAPEGAAILAALPGEVVEVGESEVYGRYIILQHAINLRTFYAHCSEIIASEGMKIRQGERIALVGQTGTATGPHLHFSVIVEGQFTDPSWVLEDNIQLVE